MNTPKKEEILQSLDTYTAINHYLRPFHNYGLLEKGKHISNPFLPKPQKTPSFNIYKSSNGIWRYKDFATGEDGDIFNLVQRINNCDFREALNIIQRDFSLEMNHFEKPIEIKKEKWSDKTITYWSLYGITQDHLEIYNIFPVKSYSIKLKNDQVLNIKSTSDDPIFAYEINADCYKIYRPLSKKYKFSWLGRKPKSYVFGFDQLPESGNIIFITGGEKDVLSLYANKQNAICLNSETARPSPTLIEELKRRFKNVVVLYDIDKTGLFQSKKIAEEFRLQRKLLPEKLKEHGGKDISDFFKFKFRLNDQDLKLENYSTTKEEGKHLSILLKTQTRLTQRKAEDIEKIPPILMQGEEGVIFPRTVNIILGKTGVHKSRLAEIMCSALIKHPDCNNTLLGFKCTMEEEYTVCYVDTERNLTEQFPFALQQILLKAGYQKQDTPDHFDYISLLEIRRKDRFKALSEYLNYVRKKFTGHIIIVLDVITDCVADFNRSDESMEFLDMINRAGNQYNATFIAVIHENPGTSNKARGHLGTEITNKSTNTIRIGFEKESNGRASKLIAIEFRKARNSEGGRMVYATFCEEEQGLILADENIISKVAQSRQIKAGIPELISSLKVHLQEPTSNRDIINKMTKEFACSDKIIRRRLKEIYDNKIALKNNEGNTCYLIKNQKGKEVYYELSPISEIVA